MFDCFLNPFLITVETHVPQNTKTRHVQNKSKNWFTHDLKQSREKKIFLKEVSKSFSTDLSNMIRTIPEYKPKIMDKKLLRQTISKK